MTTERRMSVGGLELRESSDELTLTGYASTFNQPYDMGWYTERVAPGAFTRTLGRKPDVRLLINHDGLPLARSTSGTLDLDEDKRGLMVTARLDRSDPDVERLAPKMARGDLNQMSFGFRTISDIWEDDSSKRTLRELDLNDGDVSVVTYPANPHTAAALRAAGGSLTEALTAALAALEARNAPAADVAALLSRAVRSLTPSDDETDEEAADPAGTETDTADAETVTNDDEVRRLVAEALATERRRHALRLIRA